MTAAALWDFDEHSGAVRMTGLRLCLCDASLFTPADCMKKPSRREGGACIRVLQQSVAAEARSRLAANSQLFVAPQDLATFIAPSVIAIVPSGKSQIASTPSSESMNARDSS